MKKVALPSSLLALFYGCDFNRKVGEMALPSSLLAANFGDSFDLW